MSKAHRCTGGPQLSLLAGENGILRKVFQLFPNLHGQQSQQWEPNNQRAHLELVLLLQHQDVLTPVGWETGAGILPGVRICQTCHIPDEFCSSPAPGQGKRLFCHVSIRDPEHWQPFLLFFEIVSKCDQICEQATCVVHSFQIQDVGWLKEKAINKQPA